MANPADEPQSPPPPRVPGQPLPRLRYTPPAEEPTPEPERPSSKNKKSKKPKAPEADQSAGKASKRKSKNRDQDGPVEKKGVLVDETPAFDTYEVRQRTRIAVGAALVAVILLAGFVLVRSLQPNDTLEDYAELESDDTAIFQANRASVEALEREAQIALADARSYAEQGNAEHTLQKLNGLLKSYPKTAAAERAREALNRGRQGLPLFVDVPLVIAELADPTIENEPEPEPVLLIHDGDFAGDSVEVELGPPPVPPEPRRETGVALETADLAPNPLPSGFRARPGVGVHPNGWPLEITCDQDGAAMVLVPGGTFTMGRNGGPIEEGPAHQVAMSPFYIDQHEVTIRQYHIFQQATGYRDGGPPAESEGDANVQPDMPVTDVSAHDAHEYAQWAGKALPTEAQWELTGRTIDGRIHPWGSSPPAWGRPRPFGQIDPVMSFALDMSPYGAFDLAGNAREWTADWFDPSYYDQFRLSTAVDPKGPGRGNSRIPLLTIKGSSPEWIISRRDGMRPDARLPDLGFRCVLNVEQSATAPSPAGDTALETPEQSSIPSFPPGSVPF